MYGPLEVMSIFMRYLILSIILTMNTKPSHYLMRILNNLLPVILLVLAISCTQNNRPLSPRVNHVVVQVSDLDRSVEFYTSAFDLELTDTIKSITYFNEDGSTTQREAELRLLKFPGQDFVYEMIQGAQMDSVGSGHFLHVGVDVEDIEVAFKRAVDAGAEVVVPVRKVRANDIETWQAFLKGPDGEMLELMQITAGTF